MGKQCRVRKEPCDGFTSGNQAHSETQSWWCLGRVCPYCLTKHGREDFLTRSLGQRWHVEGFPLPEGSCEEHRWHGSIAQHQCPEVLPCSRLGGARDAHVLACVLWLLPSAWVVECALKQLQAHEHNASLQKCNL